MEWKNGPSWPCGPNSVFLAILSQFWANIGPIQAQNAQIWPFQASFLDFHVKFVLRGWNYLKELISGPFYIWTILDLFWTNFRSSLYYLRAKIGLQCQVHDFYMKNNAFYVK